MRRENSFDEGDDGGGVDWEEGCCCCIWLRTLSIVESQMLWQVREAVCSLLLKCLQPSV